MQLGKLRPITGQRALLIHIIYCCWHATSSNTSRGSQLFTPSLVAKNQLQSQQAQAATAGQGTYYGQQLDAEYINGPAYGQPSQTAYAQPVADLTSQFGQMGIDGPSISQTPFANANPSYQRCTLNAIPTSEQRIRVITLALPTTTSFSEVFASADQIAILRQQDCVEQVDILVAYKSSMTVAASTQTSIGDNLKILLSLFSVYSKIIHQTQIPSDIRTYAQAL
ncbi:hypothetical protein JOM56_000100 [Amanita muscaria]